MRTLQVFINTRHVGELRDDNGIWSFAYSTEWLAADGIHAISPALPLRTEPHVDGSTHRAVQWYFDNLLPEESARALLAKDARLDAADAFSLLAYYGAESAGALILAADRTVPLARQDELPLPDLALQARIAQLPSISLSAHAPKRMSLAGAQHKLPVILRDGSLYEPAGAMPSTHILKPDNPDKDYAHSVINEYFTMRLARALRLDVPAVARRYVPEPVYLIERFDRVRQGASVQRRHMVDACQVLNLDRRFKYAAASIERLRELAERCSTPAAARLRLFSWLAFNMLVGNSDAHLKNLSFLADAKGVHLAPHYDLLAIGVYDTKAMGKDGWPHTSLAWPLLGRQSFAEIDRAVLQDAGAALGINAETSVRLLDFQVDRILGAAKTLMAGIERENEAMLAARAELAPVFAGELRCIRAIMVVVIAEMVGKLSK